MIEDDAPLPGRVPEGWKRYYLLPWCASIVGGVCGALARDPRMLVPGSGTFGWNALGLGIGTFLGMVLCTVLCCTLSEDSVRRRWIGWSAAGFAASAAAAFAAVRP